MNFIVVPKKSQKARMSLTLENPLFPTPLCTQARLSRPKLQHQRDRSEGSTARKSNPHGRAYHVCGRYDEGHVLHPRERGRDTKTDRNNCCLLAALTSMNLPPPRAMMVFNRAAFSLKSYGILSCVEGTASTRKRGHNLRGTRCIGDVRSLQKPSSQREGNFSRVCGAGTGLCGQGRPSSFFSWGDGGATS